MNCAALAGLFRAMKLAMFTRSRSALSVKRSCAITYSTGNCVFNLAKTFAWISDEGVARAFAQDLSRLDQRELAAVQGITAVGDLLATPTVTPAWKSKPSWFVIAGHDDVITAGLEKQEAQTIGAKAIELPTCHVAMLQEPARIADFISSAAGSLNH